MKYFLLITFIATNFKLALSNDFLLEYCNSDKETKNESDYCIVSCAYLIQSPDNELFRQDVKNNCNNYLEPPTPVELNCDENDPNGAGGTSGVDGAGGTSGNDGCKNDHEDNMSYSIS